jgi:aldehyde oxidoreductase
MWYRFGKCAPITCEAQAELGLDGSVTFFFSAPDYGQGTMTVMAQFAAEAMGLPRQSLRLVNADTALTPDSGIQGASRSTYWVGGAVGEAARRLRAQILGVAAQMLSRPRVSSASLQLEAGSVVAPDGRRLDLAEVAAEMDRRGQARRARGIFAPALGSDVQYDPCSGNLPFFITGAHLAEVDVNVETGEVQAARVVAVHDVGRVVNPQGAQGQIEGAVLMSLGSALMEEYLPGTSSGFSNYYLPTLLCTPEIEVVLVEVPSRWGPLGAKGLGEGAILPTAPAILNGVFRACGARVRQLPATPERVLGALHHPESGTPQASATEARDHR